MQYLIDGKPVEGVPTRQLTSLRVAREKPEADAVLISTDEALRRYTKILKILYGFLAAIIALVPAGLLAIDPNDWIVIAPVVLVIWGFFIWFLPFMYRRKVTQFRARMKTTTLPAAPGTAVRVDESGVSIDSKTYPWSALSLELIGLERVQSGGENSTSYTTLLSLGLVAGAEHIQLDGSTLSTGTGILDQIYRRLKPAA